MKRPDNEQCKCEWIEYSDWQEQKIKELKARNAKLEKRYKTHKDKLANQGRQIKALEEYNTLLGESLDAVFPIAHVHGYRESDERIKRGKELREKLNKH